LLDKPQDHAIIAEGLGRIAHILLSRITTMSQEQAIMHSDIAVSHASEANAAEGRENMKFAMWLFLSSEVMLFAVLITAYVLNRFREQGAAEHHILNIPLTSLNTFLLLTSSFTVVRALAAIEISDRKKFLRSLALTVILGATFLGVQVFEYMNLGHEGLTLSSGPFGASFFTLTGFHGAHVLIGVIWAIRVFWQAFNGKYSKDDYFPVEFFGLYWHFVDVVWILIFTVVYLI
jgi:heme/copper-type cytochrome/quinol oxidase subunit 3